jgi:hypothetical protein
MIINVLQGGEMATVATVDSTVPRAKAVFHAVIPGIAYLSGYPAAAYILAATALIMAASVLGGPRYSVFGQIYKAVRPGLGIGPGRQDLVAPHRFSEALGALCLLVAAAAYLAGLHGIAEALTLMVVALAVLNAAAGICVGCQMYLLFKRATRSATA